MNNTTFTDLIKRFLYGKPVRGESVKDKPRKRTTMPCEDITLLQWCRGEWIKYLNNQK